MTARPHLILIYQPGQAHGWPTGPGQSACLTIGGLVEFAAPGVSGNLFRREGEYRTVRHEGPAARLKYTEGLRCLARLVADPGREFHPADLEAADSRAEWLAPYVAPGGADELPVRPDLGDVGELDARAKAAYRARLDELEAELEEAERFNHPGHAARASAGRHFLVNELARAVGLGGGDRRAASHAERAMLNVTRAIRAAMVKLARASPSLGRNHAATIRTGRYCFYTPDPRAPDHLGSVTWRVVAGTRRPGGRIRRRSNNGACPSNAPAGEGALTPGNRRRRHGRRDRFQHRAQEN